MDDRRLAALVRFIEGTVSRRATLAGALTTAYAALTLRPHGDAEAKRKKKKKRRCKGGKKRCGKSCIPPTECCGGCGAETCCNGTCSDLATDGANCGACGKTCSTGLCGNGACVCDSSDDCPQGCGCALSIQNDKVCVGPDITDQQCDADADCAQGAVCRQTGGGNFCGEPCLGT